MDFTAKLTTPRQMFMLLQCLGWGTLFMFNFLMMWLSGPGAWPRSLNILVFLTTACGCSFMLRTWLKPIAERAKLSKLIFLTLIYCLFMGMATVQIGFMLLAILPNIFGGKAQFSVNLLIIISLSWSALFVVWSLLYVFIILQRDLTQTKENEARLDNLLTKAKLNTLHSQINPHFMFNAINNIRALVLEDKHKARDMMANLSDILRYSLDTEQSSLISLNKELEIVNEYIELCAIQYENRLNFELTVEEQCDALFIPRMLIQMLAENAIKHGVNDSLKKAQLIISITQTNRELIICVKNSGTLNPMFTSKPGIGLKNIRQRLAILYQEDADFTIKQQQGLVCAQAKIALHLCKNKPKYENSL